MKTTTTDIAQIISGQRLEISAKCPLPGVDKWYVRQPTDWEYDMAQAIFDAKRALVLAQPDVAEAKSLPPSDGWLRRQERAQKESNARLNTLNDQEKIAPLTVEEVLERKNLTAYLVLLLDPREYSRADEIAHDVAGDQRDWYLLHRLVVDEAGEALLDCNTEEGLTRWNDLGRQFREKELQTLVSRVLRLVQLAKN